MKSCTLLWLGSALGIPAMFVAGHSRAQMTHAQNQQMQQRHARDMNVQGWLNQQRQMQGQQSGPRQSPQPDPMEGAVNNMRALIELRHQSLTAAVQGLKALTNDPRYRKLMQGYWTQYQEGAAPEPGRRCAATFMNGDGMLGITALGGYRDPALLLLSGADVPTPDQTVKVSATLHQTGERPQTVPVYNFITPGTAAGTVAFAVPSLEAAAQGLADTAEIAVDIAGKRIYAVKYHSGREAGSALALCAGAKGQAL